MDPQELISISTLSHTNAGTRKNPGREALKGVELDIAPGEMLALRGPLPGAAGSSTAPRLASSALQSCPSILEPAPQAMGAPQATKNT